MRSLSVQSARLRYVLLLLVAGAPLVGVGYLKPAPLTFAAALFLAHTCLSFATRRRERSWPRDVLTVVLWLGCFEVSGIYLFALFAIRMWPPLTSDGHPLMPIGQLFFGIAVGGAFGAAVAFLGSLGYGRRDRRRERMVLHAIGALLFVAAVVKSVRGA
jgi:hypothetical protein